MSKQALLTEPEIKEAVAVQAAELPLLREGAISKHIVHFHRQDIRLSFQPDGVRIELTGGICREAPGAPAIPGRLLSFALPAGRRASRVTVRILAQEKLLDRPVMICPQSSPGISALAIDAPAAPRRIAMPPDPTLYTAAKDAPVAKLQGINLMGSVPVASVFVRPVRIGKSGRLELITKMELSLFTVEDRGQLIRRGVRQGPRTIRYHDIAARMVVNPEDVPISANTHSGTSGIGGTTGGMPAGAGLGRSLPGLSPVPDDAGPRHVDYLIITDNYAWDATAITCGASLAQLPRSTAPQAPTWGASGL